MQRVVVLNPKGGSGKTTLATNLASYYAVQGAALGWGTALMDYDPQGSCAFWAGRRPDSVPPIQSIKAFHQPAGVTRSWALRLQPDVRRVVVDTPAGLDFTAFQQVLQEASAILVPVLPSDVDIHAASRCIADLLLVAKVSRREQRIAVVANRVRRHTQAHERLQRFLGTLGIPAVATLRDTQNYLHAFGRGLGIFEYGSGNNVERDRASWRDLLHWLETRPPRAQGQLRAG